MACLLRSEGTASRALVKLHSYTVQPYTGCMRGVFAPSRWESMTHLRCDICPPSLQASSASSTALLQAPTSSPAPSPLYTLLGLYLPLARRPWPPSRLDATHKVLERQQWQAHRVHSGLRRQAALPCNDGRGCREEHPGGQEQQASLPEVRQ